jgi:hypothetical protein
MAVLGVAACRVALCQLLVAARMLLLLLLLLLLLPGPLRCAEGPPPAPPQHPDLVVLVQPAPAHAHRLQPLLPLDQALGVAAKRAARWPCRAGMYSAA